MARVVRWQVPFMSLDNKAYRVDIYQENYSGQVEVLKGAANPFFTQEDDDEDAFSPIRTSSGYLTVIVENMQLIDDILPNDDHDRYVELVDATDALNEVCVWNGFLAPDQYSGTWDRVPFELQLPLLSPLAAARGTRFLATELMQKGYDLIRRIFQTYVEVTPDHLWFAKIFDGYPSMIPLLAMTLTDSRFLPEEEDGGLLPIYGSNPLPALKEKSYSAVDVLEAICRIFGYVLYESPKNYYFTAADKTNVYCKVDWSDIDYTTYTLETLADHQFPSIAGNGHSRSLIPGSSMVRVYCNLSPVDVLLQLDLRRCSISSNRYNYGGTQDDDPIVEYLRYDAEYYNCKQYVNNPPAGIGIDHQINVRAENQAENDRAYVGGNWINYGEGSVVGREGGRPFRRDASARNEALIVTMTDSTYLDNLYAGSMKSVRSFSAINVGAYMDIDFTVEFSKTFGYTKFDDEIDVKTMSLFVSIVWGDYYYQVDGPRPGIIDPQWSQTFKIIGINVYSTDGRKFDTSGGFRVYVPSSMQSQLQGQIRLIFYTFPETRGIKMMRVSDIVIKGGETFVKSPVQDIYDYELVDYRQSLSDYRLSEYSYEQILSTHGISHSFSGVQVTDPSVGTSYEELLLDRLAQWYDRTIEQLSVTVENDDIQPGVRIVRGNAKYIVLSRTVDWRNGQRILTLQRMYDEPQQQT